MSPSSGETAGFWAIPSSWTWTRVGNVGEVGLGRQRSPINHSGPHMRPYVRAANVTWAGWDLSDVNEMNFDAADFVRFQLQNGDVVLNEGSGSAKEVGKSAIWRNEIADCCFQNTLLRVQPKACTSEYLQAYFTLAARSGRFVSETQGVNIFHIGKDGLYRYPVPLPPLPEQRRIVAKLDALDARAKRARADLDRIPALVARAKQAVLRAALKGELTRKWREAATGLEPVAATLARMPEILQSRGGREATTDVLPGQAAISVNDPKTATPKGWEWVSLRRIARQETGHTPSRSHPEYWDGAIAWIGIKDAGLHHGRIIEETLQTISQAGLDNSSARLLPAGTVCLSRTASVGYVTIMGKTMATSQDFATWTCSEAIAPKYLMYALMAEGADIRKFGEGSTHTTIYFPEIRAFHILLAPLAEQSEIVRRIESAFAKIDRIAVDAASASKLLTRLDQAILTKAFRGDLVPQDPKDEPAPSLLERIKDASATAPRKAGGRKGKAE